MNQAPPLIFEAIRHDSALLMVRDEYSGDVEAETHYIPVSPDYSDLVSAATDSGTSGSWIASDEQPTTT